MNLVLKQYLQNILQIPDNMLADLLDVSTIITLQKNQVISKPNNTNDRLYFIIDGAVRTFYINEKGDEVSYLLQVNGDFFGDYESYITGKSSGFVIQTILKTEVMFFEKHSIEQMIETDINWLRFAKTVADFAFLDAKKRLDELLSYNPEERYLNLLNKTPEIIRKFPQKYISTYLGITPPSLSRIRKRIIS